MRICALVLLLLVLRGATARTVVVNWEIASEGSVLVDVGDKIIVSTSAVTSVTSVVDGTPDGLFNSVDKKIHDLLDTAGVSGRGQISLTNSATAHTFAIYLRMDTDTVAVVDGSDSDPRATVSNGGRLFISVESDILLHRATDLFFCVVDVFGNIGDSSACTSIVNPNNAILLLPADTPSTGEIVYWAAPLYPQYRGMFASMQSSSASSASSPLSCVCLYPSLPCLEEVDPLPQEPSLPPVEPPAFHMWGVSPSRGSDCPGTLGSVAHPFRSIARAVCAASPGDSVYVETGGDLYEDMDAWFNCTSCVQFQFEEDVPGSALGHATLHGGGIVYLYKNSVSWRHEVTNLRFHNAHKYVHLKDDPGVSAFSF